MPDVTVIPVVVLVAMTIALIITAADFIMIPKTSALILIQVPLTMLITKFVM